MPHSLPRVTGHTRVYALIGHPVAQVRTPPAVNAYLAKTGIDAVMVPIDVNPGALPHFLATLKGWENCGGLSVTMPHKQAIFQALDEATPRARRAGSTNIVRREPDGRLIGEMTDGLAFVAALARNGFDPQGRRALLVGAAGGAGRAMADALCEAGVAALKLVDRDPARLARLAADLRSWHRDVDLDPVGEGFELAVNASPLGMVADDPLPLDFGALATGAMVADVVTQPPETPLLAEARRRGLPIQTGLDMADAQIAFQMRHLGL